MKPQTNRRSLVPAPVRHIPIDQRAVLVSTLLAIGAGFAPPFEGSTVWLSLRLLFLLPFLLFVPGYAAVSALFPESDVAVDGPDRERSGLQSSILADDEGVTVIERAMFAVALSVVLVSLCGLVVNFSPVTISDTTILFLLAPLTVALSVIASYRRAMLPEEVRFSIDLRAYFTRVSTSLTGHRSRRSQLLSLLLVVSLVFAVGSVFYTTTTPRPGESFSELYLLTESEDGLVADNYPHEFRYNETRYLYVGIENHDNRPVDYAVLAVLQRIERSNGEVRVTESQRLTQFQTRLSTGESWTRRHPVTPQLNGTHLRLTYLLYHDSPPSSPSTANAQQSVYLWVNVTGR